MRYPPEWSGLPINLYVDSDRFRPQDQSIILAEMRPCARKYAAWMPISNEMLRDAPNDLVTHFIVGGLDRFLRPWLYPGVVPFPAIELFPRWTRFKAWWNRTFPRDRELEDYEGW